MTGRKLKSLMKDLEFLGLWNTRACRREWLVIGASEVNLDWWKLDTLLTAGMCLTLRKPLVNFEAFVTSITFQLFIVITCEMESQPNYFPFFTNNNGREILKWYFLNCYSFTTWPGSSDWRRVCTDYFPSSLTLGRGIKKKRSSLVGFSLSKNHNNGTIIINSFGETGP